MSKINKEFYLRDDVVGISKELLGKYIFTKFDNKLTGGIITETEAYEGISDKASHAYGGKRTKRTETMFSKGGVAYVYLCYGVHSLFNIVTNKKDIPHAILIRSFKPTDGIDFMLERTGKTKLTNDFGTGPGKFSKALGIHFSHSGMDLSGNKIWLEDRGLKIDDKNIIASTRIGIDYAEEDALLPYRFIVSKLK